jgi:hypothetical protein
MLTLVGLYRRRSAGAASPPHARPLIRLQTAGVEVGSRLAHDGKGGSGSTGLSGNLRCGREKSRSSRRGRYPCTAQGGQSSVLRNGVASGSQVGRCPLEQAGPPQDQPRRSCLVSQPSIFRRSAVENEPLSGLHLPSPPNSPLRGDSDLTRCRRQMGSLLRLSPLHPFAVVRIRQ